jgi:hypothetical protein
MPSPDHESLFRASRRHRLNGPSNVSVGHVAEDAADQNKVGRHSSLVRRGRASVACNDLHLIVG